MDPNLKNGRLGRELTKLVHSYRSGISVTIKNESLSVLEAQITGPPDTPYENGTFTVVAAFSCSPNFFIHSPIAGTVSVRQLPLQSPQCTVPHQSVPSKH